MLFLVPTRVSSSHTTSHEAQANRALPVWRFFGAE